MKRPVIYFLSILTLSVCACRPMGDDLLSYGQYDYQSYLPAGQSFANEFISLWTAMNENYCIWDYESKFGMDWDEVYNTYLPQFKALDDTTRTTPVSDDELSKLYSQFLDSLHDGHLVIQVLNFHTGSFLTFQPGRSRNTRERPEQFAADYAYKTDLTAYLDADVTPAYKIISYDATGSTDIIIELLDSVAQRIIVAADAYISTVDAAGGPDNTNDSIYAAIGELKYYAERLISFVALPPASRDAMLTVALQIYNGLICGNYALATRQLGVDCPFVDSVFADDVLGSIQYSLFSGNIAYLRLGNFGLTMHLEASTTYSDTTSLYYAYQMAVRRVWQHWFDDIQSLHASGTLGGVIIDVRNNRGGYVNDYQYVLGALLPSGGWQSHTLRIKNGVGRLDFAPLVPFTVSTLERQHEVISDVPIVVLANSQSVSMAENTAWGVMSQPNGCFIGTRTYGALSALNTDPADYSSTYSGAFGVQYETSIWGYVPKFVCLYGDDLQPVEGYGFEPDIDLPLDTVLWLSTGRDNQLECAINYINN